MNFPRHLLRFAAITVSLLLLGLSAHAQDAFKIGQPAPEFKAGRWVKGPPVAALSPGHVYVLEFWATWCGPCKEAMPHLSELARKHAGQVTFIGVNILERGPAEQIERKVDLLVEQMGKNLDYPVCRDTAEGFLHQRWFLPTRAPGIPVTVVVDGQGKIAWIGHPEKGLADVLDQLLAGTFDYARSAVEYTRESGDMGPRMKVYGEFYEAMRKQDWARAVAIVDENSQFAASMWFMRFQALLHHDPHQAYAQLKATVEKKDPSTPNLLFAVADTDGLPAEMYQFAMDRFLVESSGFGLRALPKLAYRLGDMARAVEFQLNLKNHVLNQPKKPTAEVMQLIESDLARYEESKRLLKL